MAVHGGGVVGLSYRPQRRRIRRGRAGDRGASWTRRWADRLKDRRHRRLRQGQAETTTPGTSCPSWWSRRSTTPPPQRYDVEVTDDEVRDRVDELLGTQDPRPSLRPPPRSRATAGPDVFENVREEHGAAGDRRGRRGRPTPSARRPCRPEYQDTKRGQPDGSSLVGFITVPDQATADAVLAQLTASPATYPAPSPRSTPARTPRPEASRPASPRTSPRRCSPTALGRERRRTPASPRRWRRRRRVSSPPAGISPPTFEQVRDDLEQQATDRGGQGRTPRWSPTSATTSVCG